MLISSKYLQYAHDLKANKVLYEYWSNYEVEKNAEFYNLQ